MLEKKDEREVAYTVKCGDAVLSGKVTVGNGRSICVGKLELAASGKFVDVALYAKDRELTYQNTVRLLVKQENGLCSDEGIADFYREV